jgi:23S rRNA (cytosine1962-C5)-methyltransferase
VHLTDLSAPAIAAAERNLGHNRHLPAVRSCATRSTVGDAFDVLDQLGKRANHQADRFDIVVIDPPSFAMNKEGVDRALRAYAKLTKLGLDVLRPGGTLVQASCSSRVSNDQFFDTVNAAAIAAGRRLNEIRRTGHGVDHPVGFPQGSYLKAIFATA